MLVSFRAFGQGVLFSHHDAFGGGAFEGGALVALFGQLVGQCIHAGGFTTQGANGFQAVFVQGHLIRAGQCGPGDTAAFGGQLKRDGARFDGVSFHRHVSRHGFRRRCRSGASGRGGSRRRSGCFRRFFSGLLLLDARRLGLGELLIFLHVVQVDPRENDAERHDDPTFAIHEIFSFG